MRFLILNGPNLNMLGRRNCRIYGNTSYSNLVKDLKKYAKLKSIRVHFFQSNYEGKIIDVIQKRVNKYDGLIVNLGAFTHYSYAIMDAFECVNVPIVEVHISDINNREEFRKISLIKKYVKAQIIGEGTNGYKHAIEYLLTEGGEND